MIYEVRARTTLVTATVAAPLCALRAVTNACSVWEIHIFYTTAPTTSGGLGLCRSTALGTGTLTTVAPQARSALTGVDPSTSEIVTNWATLAPTNGGIGSVFRSFDAAPAIGGGVIWTFDREPLQIIGGAAATSELCIVNTLATAPGTFSVVFVIDE